MRLRQFFPFGMFIVACNGGQTPAPDASDVTTTTDASTNATPAVIANLPSGAPVALHGLDGPVDVVVDTHGWPHIYATTLHDALFVEGLLCARDRMAEMELIMRVASGRLAELFGGLSAGLIDQDITSRVLGLRRVAQQMWDNTPAGRTRTSLSAFTQGVNAYLANVRAATEVAPSGTELLVNDTTPDWTEVDSLVIARYQAFALSYTANDEIDATVARDQSALVFDHGADADHLARAGFFWDVNRFAAPSTATVISDFYSSMGMHDTYRPSAIAPTISSRTYSRAQPFLTQLANIAGFIARKDRGSNNWVVAASASANHHAMLANDPHLQLGSPPVWWAVHLTINGGPDAADVTGVTFPGIPGVLLGFNRHVAWGATVANYDVSDVYRETITQGATGATARFQNTDVPIQVIHESVGDGSGGTIDVPIEMVPQHGPIVPTIVAHRVVARTDLNPLSLKWTGFAATHDVDTLLGLMYSTNVAEARQALTAFDVGAQNWVIADTAGNIGYTTHSIVPVRDPRALSWNPDTALGRQGTLPCFVLPGTGEAEWTGTLDPSLLPNGVNTATRSFFATANNDQVGLVADNNPTNDPVFLSSIWAEGWRAEEIQNRLMARGNSVSLDDMQSIQNDHVLLVGGRFRPFLVAAVTALQDELQHPGTHADLTALAAIVQPHAARWVQAMTAINAWSLDSPTGLDAGATDANKQDAIATTIFHTWMGHLITRALHDEITATQASVSDPIRGLLFLLEHPDQTLTLDATTHESAIWDDLSTLTVKETRNAIIAGAFEDALSEIVMHAGTEDTAQWVWGKFHFIRFNSLIPGPGSLLSIPQSGDAMFPNGFPRPGGIESVDQAWAGFTYPYVYGSGPSQRVTVELDPAGPHAYNVLPGGESIDVNSPHHRDEAELWRTNQVHPVPQTPAEVAAAFESHARYVAN